AHGLGGIDQRVVGEGAEEPHGIEEIGLAGAMDAGDAREGTEVEVQVEEILEAGDSQAREHASLPPAASGARPWRHTILPSSGHAHRRAASVRTPSVPRCSWYIECQDI